MEAFSFDSTQIILFTSCKGGVGKSTVCANLAMALARRGRRVLLVDCDFGNRCLDLVAGLSDEVIYDIGDLAFGRVSPERAVIQDRRSENLSFIAAPYGFDNRMSTFSFKSTIRRLAAWGNAEAQEIPANYLFKTPADVLLSLSEKNDRNLKKKACHSNPRQRQFSFNG